MRGSEAQLSKNPAMQLQTGEHRVSMRKVVGFILSTDHDVHHHEIDLTSRFWNILRYTTCNDMPQNRSRWQKEMYVSSNASCRAANVELKDNRAQPATGRLLMLALVLSLHLQFLAA